MSVPTTCEIAATVAALIRRLAKPPKKSASPQETPESNPSRMVVIALDAVTGVAAWGGYRTRS